MLIILAAYFALCDATQFYMLRHAQGFHNAPPEGFSGDWASDPLMADAELTTVGIAQTLNKRQLYTDMNFDQVYVSPLRRCRQTLLGVYPVAANLTVIVDDRLIEQTAYGAVCNKRVERDDVISTSPRGWDFRGVGVVNPYGPSSDEMDFEKIRSFTKDVLAKWPDGTVLVVAHAGWIWRWFEMFNGGGVSLGNCEMETAVMN